MTMLLEQPASPTTLDRPRPAQPRADADGVSRWALVLAHTDLFAQTEVSTARRVAAWIALAICLAVLVLLAFGL